MKSPESADRVTSEVDAVTFTQALDKIAGWSIGETEAQSSPPMWTT